MEHVGELKALANQAAAREHGKIANIEKRLADIEDEKARVEVLLRLASTARQRALDFQPMLGVDYQCPTCWIKYENRAALRPIVREPGDDRFQCSRCKEEFSFVAH